MSNTQTDLFRHYRRSLLIETGSYHGNGIQCALDADYERVISIEVLYERYIECSMRYILLNRSVKIVYGTSPDILIALLPLLSCPITIWLDAHHSGPGSGGTPEDITLLQELDVILGYEHCRECTIIIDDFNILGRDDLWLGKLSQQSVFDKLLDSPLTRFSHDHLGERVLVANTP